MPRKKTQECFINEVTIKHNNKYDYSLVEYKNNETKIKIICPKHGLFEQRPGSHIRGDGCPVCNRDRARDFKTVSHDCFLQKLKMKQPELFYLIVFKQIYTCNKDKLLLGSKYGDVIIQASELLQGTKPNISNAVDKDKYFLNILEEKQPQLYKSLILIGNYEGDKYKMLFMSPYGKVLLIPYNTLNGKSYNITNAVNKNEYLFNYLKIHQPQYIENGFEMVSNYIKNSKHIEFKLNGLLYKASPRSLMCGSFSDCWCEGVYNKTLIERHKDKYKNMFCMVYKIKLYNKNENFYKIGITTRNTKHRAKNFPYKFEIIDEINTNLYEAYYLEQKLHKELKEYKYKPLITFGGQTECFTKI